MCKQCPGSDPIELFFRFLPLSEVILLLMIVVEIRMKSAAAGKTRFFDPPHMIFAA